MGRLGRLRLVLATGLVALTTSVLAATATAGDDGFRYGWGRTIVKCYENNYELVFAHVSVTLWVHSRGHFRHWITNMRLEARLSGGGSNMQRSWRKSRFPVHSELLQDHNYSHAFAVNTDVMSPEEEWTLQVKQIWDRRRPWEDLVHEYEVPFDTSDCKKGHIKGEGEGVSLGRFVSPFPGNLLLGRL